MKEDLLQFIWQYKLFDHSNLLTVNKQPIQILNPGELNKDSGPDFFNSKIKIGDIILAGNVEVHVNAGDWNKHGHQHDAAYKNIILHVVYYNDSKTSSVENCEVLELKNHISHNLIKKYESLVNSKKALACTGQIGKLDSLKIQSWLNRMLIERLEKKTEYIQQQFEQCKNDYSQTFYLTLAKNFGFKTNAEPFENLARHLPLSLLLKHSDNLFQIEALLFGTAGLLDKSYKDKYLQRLQNEFEFLKNKYGLVPLNAGVWKFMRMRPANFPSVRMWQLAKLIHHSPNLFSEPQHFNSIKKLSEVLQHEPEGYWQTHYNPGGKPQQKIGAMGIQSIENILINTIAPFLFFYGKQSANEHLKQAALESFEGTDFESNVKTRYFTKEGLNFKSSGESQALINLFDNYCKNKQCLKCGIASQLLIKL